MQLMAILMKVVQALLLGAVCAFLVGCTTDDSNGNGDGSVLTDSSGGGRDSSSGRDASTDSTQDDAANSDTSSGGGAGFFATFTIGDNIYTTNCPAPDDDQDTPYLIQFFAGNEENIGCGLDHTTGFLGRSAALNFGDRRTFADGAIDNDWGGGVNFKAQGDDADFGPMVTKGGRNLDTFSVTGTYDAATRRLQGSFQGTWNTDRSPDVYGHGEASGTFDLILLE